MKFWCAIGEASQLAFADDGSTAEVKIDGLPVGECHIVVNDVLLCKQSRDKLKSDVLARRQKNVEHRVKSIPLCPVCEQKFKTNGNLPWRKWVDSVT
jgi:hypothetical protein